MAAHDGGDARGSSPLVELARAWTGRGQEQAKRDLV